MLSKRRAFTTVELLVVIAIIAILAALIFAGVQAVRGREALNTTRIEISDMARSLENFKARYGIYPPSQIVVLASGPDVDATSKGILSRIWPSINYSQAFGANGMGVTQDTIISGDQCLVLFLGGRHDANGCQGYSTSKSNPFAAGGDREQPLYNFKTNRLFRRDSSSPFFSYGDGWHDPNSTVQPCYAYFVPRGGGYMENDCSLLLDNHVYVDSTGTAFPTPRFPKPFKEIDSSGTKVGNKWLNPTTFQLISSGKDRLWGRGIGWRQDGTVVNSTAPAPPSGAKPPPALDNNDDGNAGDNVANFASGLLAGG